MSGSGETKYQCSRHGIHGDMGDDGGGDLSTH